MGQQSFKEKLQWGEEGEQIIGNLLMDKGYSIVPLYQYANTESAPSLFVGGKSLILPDIQIFGNNKKPFWVECKRKRKWVHWKKKRETGFDAYSFKHYKKIQELTGLKVYIVFIHEDETPTGIYAITSEKFEENARFWDGLNSKTKEVITNAELLISKKYLTKIQ